MTCVVGRAVCLGYIKVNIIINIIIITTLQWCILCCCCPVCPNISLIALTGSLCPDNGELIVTGSASVLFNCSYDNPLGPTDYTWYLDGVRQTAYTSYSATIPVSTGSHVVKCEAEISETANCTCRDFQTINVSTVGA